MSLHEVSQGQSLSAGGHNEIVRAIRRMGTSGGAAFAMPDVGIVGLLPTFMPEYAKWARITAYTGPAPDATGGVACELITYNVAFVPGTSDVLINQRPHFGHAFPDGVKVKPAAVGSPAVVLRFPKLGDIETLLYVFSGRRGEQVVVAQCAGGGGGA